MNKTELINAVAEKANLSKAQAKAALDATLNTISEALLKEDKVALIGFGTFSVAEKPARTGINPRTKEKIEIPARKAVKFKVAGGMSVACACRHVSSRSEKKRCVDRYDDTALFFVLCSWLLMPGCGSVRIRRRRENGSESLAA